MVRKIDRRAFLGLSVGALAWACARDGDDGDGGAAASGSPSGGSGAISVLAGAPVLAIGDTRQPIVILRGQRPIAPDGVVAELSGPGIEPFEVEPAHHRVLRGLGGGDGSTLGKSGTEVDDIYVVRHDFDRAGTWDIAVTFDGGSGTAAFQVVEDAKAPKVGDEAIASDSPTIDDPKDVDPICTRDPVCSMHEVSIARALEMSKPIVISFSTPRFCTSRACGPVVDIIENEKDRVGEDATFIHVEVWKDDDAAVGRNAAPAFAEWGFDGEPWTYFIDADGIVRDRWLGPVASGELTRAVDALVAGEL